MDILFSVIIFVVVSVYVVQLFISTSRASVISRDYDIANSVAVSCIELFKSYGNSDEYFSKVKFTSSLLGADVDGNHIIISYYNPHWESIVFDDVYVYPYVYVSKLTVKERYYVYDAYKSVNSFDMFQKGQSNLVYYSLMSEVMKMGGDEEQVFVEIKYSSFYRNRKVVNIVE
jgi:hypothetical protein